MAEGKLARVYLMGYEPPGWDMEAVYESGGIERMMDTVDVCCHVGDGDGWPVGEIIVPNHTYAEGKTKEPVLEVGKAYRCVRHEHDGKICIVEPVED